MTNLEINDALDALFVPNATGDIDETEVKVLLKEILAKTRPYKVLTGKITQSLVNNPTLNILENTFGETFIITRGSVGKYSITSPNSSFIFAKTVCMVESFPNTAGGFSVNTYLNFQSISSLNLVSMKNGILEDGLINNCFIEFRVYE